MNIYDISLSSSKDEKIFRQKL